RPPAQRVDALAAGGLAHDQAGVAHEAEVGGDARLVEAELAGEVADGRLAAGEGVDQADAGLVGEHAREPGDRLLLPHSPILHLRSVVVSGTVRHKLLAVRPQACYPINRMSRGSRPRSRPREA